MTPILLLLVIISESCSAAGQIFFKKAVDCDRTRRGVLAAGVVIMAVGFFLWVGLMSRFELSYLYPFDGLNRVLLMIGASIFLKEKVTLNLLVGVTLICAGILLVSSTYSGA